jgi:mono/diheme cytochrome c family protein
VGPTRDALDEVTRGSGHQVSEVRGVSRLKTALKIVAGTALALVLLGVGGVYGLSSMKLEARPELPTDAAIVRSEEGDVARGDHLAHILGCRRCHGEDLGGRIFIDQPMFGRLIAPNLTRIRTEYTDADFVRVLRHGVRPDGTGVLPAMPAQAFTHLSLADLAAIIAYLRSVAPVADSLPSTRLALPLRGMLLFGVLQMVPDLIDHERVAPASTPSEDQVRLGEYLAHSICTECHGPDLKGQDRLMITPHLAVAASYPPEQFRALLRTGVGVGDRQLGAMTNASLRFSHFTDEEIDALHTYLNRFAMSGSSG